MEAIARAASLTEPVRAKGDRTFGQWLLSVARNADVDTTQEAELSALRDEVSAYQKTMKNMLDTFFAVVVGLDWQHLLDDYQQAQRNLEGEEEEIRRRWGAYSRKRAAKATRRTLPPVKQEDGSYKPPGNAYKVARKITGRK